MRSLTLGSAAVMAGLVVAPNLASALPAVTTEPTNLRAGPAFDFPVVDELPSEVRVNVHGCVRAYRWCDVSWRDARGWVPGEQLAYLDGGRRVTIVEYGPRVRLPVIVYSVDTYWDRYYRSRPWYGERTRWRTVWREREGGERRSSDRVRDRREDRSESRTDRQVDRPDRSPEKSGRDDADRRERGNVDRRTEREGRSNSPTGRSDGRSGEIRGYRGTDRGPRQDNPGGGQAEPSVRTPGPSGPASGADGGGRGGDGPGRGGRGN